MYVPDHFAEARPEELHRLIEAHPLGVLVTHGDAGLDANHLPFELDAAAGGLGDVRAWAISGQQHGMVALDSRGRVVRPALLWNDLRSSDAATALIARYGAAKREQVQESADALRQIEGRLLGTVLNFAPSKRRGKYGYGGDYGYDYGYGHSHQAESQSEEQVASGRRVLSPEEVATPQPRV